MKYIGLYWGSLLSSRMFEFSEVFNKLYNGLIGLRVRICFFNFFAGFM